MVALQIANHWRLETHRGFPQPGNTVLNNNQDNECVGELQCLSLGVSSRFCRSLIKEPDLPFMFHNAPAYLERNTR